MTTYAILGGGVSGLSAAYYLKNSGVKAKILLIEGSNRLGGWVNSYQNENGTIFELGPRTLRASGNAGSNTLQLAESLNLEDKINPIPYSHVSAQNRMIKVNNELHKLPNSLKSAFKTLPPFSKPLIVHLLKDLTASKVISDDESFYSFVQRRFGTEVAKYAVDPLCRGVFAGNAKDLSAKAFSKRIYEGEQKYDSVIKGLVFGKDLSEKKDPLLKGKLIDRAKNEKWSIWSLKGGLQTLINALEAQIENSNVEILTENEVTEIKREGRKLSIITKKDRFTVDKVISCLPAYALKNAIPKLNPNLHSLLGTIPYVSVALVNLEFAENLIKEPAFGYLVPSSEPCKVLGVIYDSCVFPQENRTILTVMMGGYWFEHLFENDPTSESVLNVALDEIRSTFKTNAKPVNYKVSIHKNCIPQYTVGHFERVDNMKLLLKGENIFLAGNSYEGVGVNDAIYVTKKVILDSL